MVVQVQHFFHETDTQSNQFFKGKLFSAIFMPDESIFIVLSSLSNLFQFVSNKRFMFLQLLMLNSHKQAKDKCFIFKYRQKDYFSDSQHVGGYWNHNDFTKSLPADSILAHSKRYVIISKNLPAMMQFPRGNIYQIICHDGNQALRISTNNHKEYEKSRVNGTGPNAHDLGQLWMVEKVGHGEDQYEIVNCQSNLVWDEEGREVKLRFGKQKSDQLFKVEKAGNGWWFKTSSKGDQAVCLEGVLRYKDFDPNATNQIFYIVPVNQCNALNNTCILVSATSGKAVDIPQGTHDHGERLVQWEKNKRFNQRWRWEQHGNGYLLVSVLTGQAIDIAGEKKDPESKVVQWDRTGGSNQIWRPVSCGQGVWRIQSCHAAGQALSVHNNSIDDGAKIEINNSGNATLWRIEGHVPQ